MKPNMNDLIPPARDLYIRFEEDMKLANVIWKPTCIKRTRAEHVALYAQGRDSISVVNELRRVAGLGSLNSTDNKKVTWTKNSRHLPIEKGTPLAEAHPDWVGLCYAWDIVIMKDGKTASWDLKVDVDKDNIPDYEEAARVGEKLGLIIGARWSTPDWPHYEYPIKNLL